MANRDYFVCPSCGEELPLKAKFCPECGSDEQTGWSEDWIYDGVDIPALDEEEETEYKHKRRGITKNSRRSLQRKRLALIFFLLFILVFLLRFIRFLVS
jgi:uncharacterized membrane protein YvbJ